MNQGIFTLLIPSKPKQTSENRSVPIYVDTSFTSKITIEIKQNMLISDILKFIHGDDDKQNLHLVLIHYSVQRRLWNYEKVEDVLHNNNSKFVICDFQKKQQIQGQKYPKYFDDNFKAYGKLLKKNKLGIYIATQVYLSQTYFGFKNDKKEKIKLSCLDNVRLYTWQNNTKFDFQIENERKLYFFQALKETDFNYWIRTIQESLNEATYKSLLYEMDIRVQIATRNQINRIEEFAQDSLQQIQINGEYLKQLKSQITDICDVNILEFLLTKNKDFIIEIRKQIEKDTYGLIKPLESQSQVEPLRIFTQRYHSLIKKDCDLDQIFEDLNDEITSAYLGFLKIQKIRTKIILQARVQFKEQFSQFNPSFDQFYN
ncbi:unnamed protein product [Paramecium pentaurelia]|uniref:PH domain-containing protein n=1 Tax=Paramecium pentaurelia TaxID=43138 RepID=A0A8S1U910_9CILI|nr:unnamed protein product [Paramecium pentaurelia]